MRDPKDSSRTICMEINCGGLQNSFDHDMRFAPLLLYLSMRLWSTHRFHRFRCCSGRPGWRCPSGSPHALMQPERSASRRSEPPPGSRTSVLAVEAWRAASSASDGGSGVVLPTGCMVQYAHSGGLPPLECPGRPRLLQVFFPDEHGVLVGDGRPACELAWCGVAGRS